MAEYITKEAAIEAVEDSDIELFQSEWNKIREKINAIPTVDVVPVGKAIERQAKKMRGHESNKKIAVIQKDMNGECLNWFDSLTKAAENVNGSTSAISAVCKGKRKTAYGYLWEYGFCDYCDRNDGGTDIEISG